MKSNQEHLNAVKAYGEMIKLYYENLESLETAQKKSFFENLKSKVDNHKKVIPSYLLEDKDINFTVKQLDSKLEHALKNLSIPDDKYHLLKGYNSRNKTRE